MNPQATAGRIVHYYAGDILQPHAAIVNRDTPPNGIAEVTVFFSGGPDVFFSVPYSEEPARGCWSWMPYQKAKAQTAEGNVSESAEPRPIHGGHMASMPEAEQRGPEATGQGSESGEPRP